jgi:glutamyl/glutaminyl-tRNA synthetase
MAIDTQTLTPADRVKLKDFLEAAERVFQETDDLKAGLKDTAKTIAEEFGWKPGTLMKAARVAYKASIQEEKTNFDTIEEILEVCGRL